MGTTEHTINDAIASVLRATRRAWSKGSTVRSENTGVLKGSAGRPDILISEPMVSPVVVETEVLPAVTVEEEACSRLGCQLKANGRTIMSSIAVRLPLRLRDKQGEELKHNLTESDDLEFALYTGTSFAEAVRYPSTGWIVGDLSNISVLVQAASVPPVVVEEAANHLVAGVSTAAAWLQELNATHPGAVKKIAEALKQDTGEQTLRMAATMLVNALVFHETLANGPGGLAEVQALDELRDKDGFLSKKDVLVEWQKILDVNYWPIFHISSEILRVIPPETSSELLRRLADTSEELLKNRLMRSHDLTGAVFQRVIADRKFLAAYYTTPASASLLVGLAVNKHRLLGKENWANPEKVTGLRVADFSCGTGTLISTAYQKIGQLHELHGGDAEKIHPEMMAHSLVACDVLPAAAHLTASMLAGTHPTVRYTQSSILTVAYGVLSKGVVATGSLDLLDPQKKMEEWAITAKAAGAYGESEENPWTTLPHQTFDVVVMNPPFVRATGQEGKKKGVPNPMFAAFSATKEVQLKMGRALDRLARGSTAHGNAGLASYFFVLADKKLRVGGVLALVMPLSLLSGEAWEETRRALAKKYSDITVFSIAGAKDEDMAFSADTGMGECLVVATKSSTGITEPGQQVADASKRALFIVLNARPDSQLSGQATAQQILGLSLSGAVRRLEAGPIGGTRITFGSDLVGHAIDAPLPHEGAWGPTRVADVSLVQAAYQIYSCGRVWLPGLTQAGSHSIAMSTVGAIGTIGPYHADIAGSNSDGGPRGPFEWFPVEDPSSVTYPILWGHDAEREKAMCFEADGEGIVRDGVSAEKVAKISNTRSHCHFNQNFRFTSQSTAMQYTKLKTIGGRAWISVELKNASQEKALVAWGNTTLGILIHWDHANKQQAGRGNVVPTSLLNLPVLDVTSLSAQQLEKAAEVFDSYCSKEMLTVDELDVDPIRKALDYDFLTQVLGFPEDIVKDDGPLDLLRKKLAKEPSISARRPGEKKRSKKTSKKQVVAADKKVKGITPQPKKIKSLTLF